MRRITDEANESQKPEFLRHPLFMWLGTSLKIQGSLLLRSRRDVLLTLFFIIERSNWRLIRSSVWKPIEWIDLESVKITSWVSRVENYLLGVPSGLAALCWHVHRIAPVQASPTGAFTDPRLDPSEHSTMTSLQEARYVNHTITFFRRFRIQKILLFFLRKSAKFRGIAM